MADDSGPPPRRRNRAWTRRRSRTSSATFSQEHFQLDSLLVVRNGHIVAEAYAPPFTAELRHHLYSASKSVTSALDRHSAS